MEDMMKASGECWLLVPMIFFIDPKKSPPLIWRMSKKNMKLVKQEIFVIAW